MRKRFEPQYDKKGKLSMREKEEENQTAALRLKNEHSAVESDVHARGTRDLDSCSDRTTPTLNNTLP